MLKTAFNGSDSPVVVDDEGHQIGGGEWGTADSTHDGVKAAVDLGTLVWVDVDPEAEGVNPDAKAAGARTTDLKERTDKFGELDADELHKVARKAALLGDDEDPPAKRVLVSRLAHSATPIPAAKSQRGQTGPNKPKEA